MNVGRPLTKSREVVVKLLLEDSRMTLTEMHKRTGIPISTLWDSLFNIKHHFDFKLVPRTKKGEHLIKEAKKIKFGGPNGFRKESNKRK